MSFNVELKQKEVSLLLKEAGMASSCIGNGLNALKRANTAYKWNYYQAFFQLAIGIERLLKLIHIAEYRLNNSNKLPVNAELKKAGHDINKLIKTVKGNCRSQINGDFLEEEIYGDIIDFITEFAKGSRYYNLDGLTGTANNKDPLIYWKEIQGKIMEENGIVSKGIDPAFINMANRAFLFWHYDEEDKLVKNASEFFKDADIIDEITGFSVYYFYKIIQFLVEELRTIEYHGSQFPFLREFFPYFIAGWDEDEDIDVKTWEDWNYLNLYS